MLFLKTQSSFADYFHFRYTKNLTFFGKNGVFVSIGYIEAISYKIINKH